jgi:CRP-like cAMP-binding protein
MLLQDKELPENKEFGAGQNIYVEEHPCNHAYIITQGKVELSYYKDNVKHVARIAQKGDLLAELDWMNYRRHLLTAKALENTICLKIPSQTLIKYYQNSPAPMQGVIRNTINLLRSIKGKEGIISAADILGIIKDIENPNFEKEVPTPRKNVENTFDSFEVGIED